MKKLLLTILTTVFITNIFLSNALARDVVDDINQAVKQIGCGQLGAPCCYKNITTVGGSLKFPIDIPVISKIIDTLMIPLNAFFNLIWSPISELTNKLYNKINIDPCLEKDTIPSNEKDPANCICLKKEDFNISRLCQAIKNPSERTECISCSSHGFWTALGCFDFSLSKIIQEKVFGLGIGLAGIFALLCIIYSAFQLQISQGNPEKIKKAQELLTSCIMGLMLIIFSVFILRLIGVDILKIPGLK